MYLDTREAIWSLILSVNIFNCRFLALWDMLQLFWFWPNGLPCISLVVLVTLGQSATLEHWLENMGSGSSVNVKYKYSLQKSENGEWFLEKWSFPVFSFMYCWEVALNVFLLWVTWFSYSIEMRFCLSVSCDKRSQVSGRRQQAWGNNIYLDEE